jgi:predicted DNA-binding protein (MmcQ/YjbR family)
MGDLCYLVSGKMYCVAGLEQPLKVSMKVTAEDFGTLIERHGIIPAPYVARNKWILVEKPGALTLSEWEHFIRQSYELVVANLRK